MHAYNFKSKLSRVFKSNRWFDGPVWKTNYDHMLVYHDLLLSSEDMKIYIREEYDASLHNIAA